MLVDRDKVNPNTLNTNCTTALWIAAQKGPEGLVKRLLEQVNVNPAPADKDGQTPVFGGGKEGYEKWSRCSWNNVILTLILQTKMAKHPASGPPIRSMQELSTCCSRQ